MKYKDIEIRAEVRVFEQWVLDDAGNLLDKFEDADDSNIEGYYAIVDGEGSDNFPSLDDVKSYVDEVVAIANQ